MPDAVDLVPVTIDRPPAAHDWRYVVRTFGKVLIATGLLLGGFVAYQLWGTGIEARRAQNELEDEFESLLASTTTAVSPVSTDPPDTASDTAPPETASGTTTDTAPSDIVAPVTVPIAAGDPIARLEIPAIGLDVVVVSGVSVDDLRRGPGHYPDTPLPGEYGNSAIAGHRTTYGQPFHDVDDLEPGDEIVVTTIAGRFVYAVTGTEIVDPGDIHVVATTDPNTAQLTLTSCHPK
jgi:sortase A